MEQARVQGRESKLVGEEPDTIEEVYEPFLIMQGYLKRTPQGRVPTEATYKKLGISRAASQNEPL